MARPLAFACTLACAHLALACDEDPPAAAESAAEPAAVEPAQTAPEPAAREPGDEPAGGDIVGVGAGFPRHRATGDGPLEPVDPRSRVRAREITVTGALDETVVRRVLRRYRTDLRACHTAALAAQGDVEGELTLELAADASGAVTAARGNDSTLPDGVRTCIEQRARDWSLPAPGTETVVVRATFVFSLEARREAR